MADAAEATPHPRTRAKARFSGLLNWLRQLRGAREGEPILREELEELIEEHAEETPIDPHERRLLANILKLHELDRRRRHGAARRHRGACRSTRPSPRPRTRWPSTAIRACRSIARRSTT